MSPDERRRQLLGIGLSMLVERPIQDLSIDAVAEKAGISRGLLFHYFPTKTDYYREVIAAALRRVRRNVSPDSDATGEQALTQFVERFFAQIQRRREFYIALVYGSGELSLGGEDLESHRTQIARQIIDAAELDESGLPVVHAWLAYVEDRALQWSGDPTSPVESQVDHCVRALDALLRL